MNRLLTAALAAAILAPAILDPGAALAQSTCALPVDAWLGDLDGAPADGPVDVELRFYVSDHAEAPALDCRVINDVPVRDGWMRAMVDACGVPEPGDSGCGAAPLTDLFDTALAADGRLFMGVTIGDDVDELGPRVEVGAVPFSVRAGAALYADEAGECLSLAGFDPADYLRADADIDADTFAGRPVEDFELAGMAEDLVDDALALHAADPDAHHSATSDGLDITPASVTVGSTSITDGTVDLGDGADDALTAAMVETLTGGGNADALHTHAGSGGGGACYTAWGRSSCLDGWAMAYSGYAVSHTATVFRSGSFGGAGAGGPICIAAEGADWYTENQLLGSYTNLLQRSAAMGSNRGSTYTAARAPEGLPGFVCAVCCR